MYEKLLKENNALKTALYGIEKVMLELRLSQLENTNTDIQQVNVPMVRVPQGLDTPYEIKVTTPEVLTREDVIEIVNEVLSQSHKCNCHSKEQELIEGITANISKAYEETLSEEEFEQELDEYDKAEIEEVKSQIKEINEAKQRKPRKERGGSVFTDFKTLNLDNDNNFEGNSIVYSKANN